MVYRLRTATKQSGKVGQSKCYHVWGLFSVGWRIPKELFAGQTPQVEGAVAQRAERGSLQVASAFGHVNTLRAMLLSCGPSGLEPVLPHALANSVSGCRVKREAEVKKVSSKVPKGALPYVRVRVYSKGRQGAEVDCEEAPVGYVSGITSTDRQTFHRVRHLQTP
eukprot:1153532-Pelagomonas_calceolata.AAC.8